MIAPEPLKHVRHEIGKVAEDMGMDGFPLVRVGRVVFFFVVVNNFRKPSSDTTTETLDDTDVRIL